MHPAPNQCLRQSTHSARRLNIRDLLTPSQCEGGIHQALMKGGYGFAASRLAQTFPQVAIGLGYSAGGTLLWKAVCLGMQVEALICVASTRLRDEDPKDIQVPTLVVTGELDLLRRVRTGQLEAVFGTSSCMDAGTGFMGLIRGASRPGSIFGNF